jgi:RNA polymerase sigma-54 factor
VGARQTLQEQLRLQLRTLGDPSDQAPGNYLIANIDPDGYLRCDFREAAQALGVSDADVSRAARLLQSFEPAGVAARSLQECLLLQARALRREPGIPRLLEPLLDRYWKELAAGKWREIARGLRTSSDEVEAAVRWLRLNLTPYPGSRHRPAGEEFFDPSPPPIFPDLRVQAGPAGGLTLLDGSEEPFELHLNPYYARLLQQMDEAPEAFSDAERSHVREYVLRARRLLRSVEERRATLRRIGETLLREQNAYFRTEREEAMRPFTQAQLASLLGLHESTISRALAEKFLQLSSGRVVPLSYFFDRALSHRKLVANIVASEDPAAPLSDQEISDMLKGQGISIARRTVMKYREELNILSSRQRARVRV